MEAMRPLDDPAASLPFIQDILGSLRQEIDSSTTLLGFVGSPWTLTAYAMEGAAERHCKATKVRTGMLSDFVLRLCIVLMHVEVITED